MCGIVGYIGNKKAVPFLLQGLEKLEYRGYDSSGIAVWQDGKINAIKKAGRLKVMENAITGASGFNGNLGIGHTRWATHGEPSDINAHPHLSQSKKIAVVHNGIIENYITLKAMLTKKGYSFLSDTDTEVVAQLIDYLYEGDILEAVNNAIKLLEGSFALGVVCSENSEVLIAAKKDSPLIIGLGKDENYIASDIPAVLAYTKEIYRLQEHQIAAITKDNIDVYDFNGNKIPLEITRVDWSVDAASKGGYSHFMMKEIMEQPEVINRTINPCIKNGTAQFENLDFSKEYVENLEKIYVVACGSAYHVGCVAKYTLEELTRKPVEVDLASEFRYRNPIINKNTLVIIISQSGETADSLAALREAKKRGAPVLSIVNVVGSSIASESDYVLYTRAGPEIAVATTKAYSTQLTLIYLLALYIGKILNTINENDYKNYIDSLAHIPEKIQNLLNQKDSINSIAKKYHKTQSVFFIGRTFDYTACLEGSLKLKEISYIHSEAYAAGELKHGPISLIDEDTLVIALATVDKLFDKTVSNIREVKSRGAKILAITTQDKKDKLKEIADDLILVPEICGLMSPSVSVITLQLLAYYIALLKDCDIDKPRNLAKSVTVE